MKHLKPVFVWAVSLALACVAMMPNAATAEENAHYWAVTNPPASVYSDHLLSGDTRYEAGVAIVATPINWQDGSLEILYQTGHFNPIANAAGRFRYTPLSGGNLRIDGEGFTTLFQTLTPATPDKIGNVVFNMAYPLVLTDLIEKANAAADAAKANARAEVREAGGNQAAQDAAAEAIQAEQWAGVLRIAPALAIRR